MYHKALRYILVALLCVSLTKAGVNKTHNQETYLDDTGKQHKTNVHVNRTINAEVPDRKLSNGKDIKSFETSTKGADKVYGDPKLQKAQTSGTGGTYALDSTKLRTPDSMQFSLDGKKSISQATGIGVLNNTPDVVQPNSGSTVKNTKADFPSYSPRGQTNKPTAVNLGNITLSGSSIPPNTDRANTADSGGSGYVLPSGSSIPQNSFGINTPNNGGSGYVVPSGSSIPQNSVGTKAPNSGGSGYVVPSGSSIPQNSFGSNTPNNVGSGYVVPSGSSIPQNNVEINTPNSAGSGYVVQSGSSIPQNNVGINTPNSGGSGYFVPSGSSIPQNSFGSNTPNNVGSGYVVQSGSSVPPNNVGINTSNTRGVGYVLPSGGSIPQNNFGAKQGSPTPTGNLQTTRINSGFPVSVNAGGSVYTPTYKPGGTVTISGGGFGGSYGLKNGGFLPGYNIGIQQSVRNPSISTRAVGGQISGGMLSGRSQSGIMFPAGTQQIKVGYGTSATMGQVGYVPQTHLNPTYTSVATSGRIPATTGFSYSGIPAAGVRMAYGQNQVISGAQVRLPSTNIQYMSSAAVPMGAVKVYGR